jgi:hypothetical protein
VSGSGDWPGDETAETKALGLPPAERQILAALAVVGHASLSADELADVGLADDVIPLLEDLERRGLVRLDDRRRYSVLGGIGAQLRHTDSALASGDRLLGHFTTLARGGALTSARLEEEAAAILGITEWAAEVGRFAGLLELVKTLQVCFDIGHRAQEWLILVQRARGAARALGDRQSEIWALEQLAAAAASAGDAQAAQRYLREADELRYGSRPVATREVTETVVAPPPPSSGGGVPAWVLWGLGIVLALVAGVGLGFALDGGGSSGSDTTASVPVTLTRPGTTLTTQETVTLPATTVVTTSVSTETTTVTTTVTTSSALTGPG